MAVKYNECKKVNRWMVVLLKETCDLSTDVENVEDELRRVFGDGVEFFIPIHSELIGGKRVSRVFIDRYIFVKKTDDVDESSFKNKTERIEGILDTRGKYVNDDEISRIKKAMTKDVNRNIPKKGQIVIPIEGSFKNLEGRVISVNKAKMVARVVFERSSRTVEAPINIINLEILYEK